MVLESTWPHSYDRGCCYDQLISSEYLSATSLSLSWTRAPALVVIPHDALSHTTRLALDSRSWAWERLDRLGFLVFTMTDDGFKILTFIGGNVLSTADRPTRSVTLPTQRSLAWWPFFVTNRDSSFSPTPLLNWRRHLARLATLAADGGLIIHR